MEEPHFEELVDCRYSDRIKLIISVHNTPLTIQFSDTNVRVECGDFDLMNNYSRVLSTKKLATAVYSSIWFQKTG